MPGKRSLTACARGDFWRKKVVPMIRIPGRWVMEAGIQPDDRVSVENPEPGVLVVRRVCEANHVDPQT